MQQHEQSTCALCLTVDPTRYGMAWHGTRLRVHGPPIYQAPLHRVGESHPPHLHAKCCRPPTIHLGLPLRATQHRPNAHYRAIRVDARSGLLYCMLFGAIGVLAFSRISVVGWIVAAIWIQFVRLDWVVRQSLSVACVLCLAEPSDRVHSVRTRWSRAKPTGCQARLPAGEVSANHYSDRARPARKPQYVPPNRLSACTLHAVCQLYAVRCVRVGGALHAVLTTRHRSFIDEPAVVHDH